MDCLNLFSLDALSTARVQCTQDWELLSLVLLSQLLKERRIVVQRQGCAVAGTWRVFQNQVVNPAFRPIFYFHHDAQFFQSVLLELGAWLWLRNYAVLLYCFTIGFALEVIHHSQKMVTPLPKRFEVLLYLRLLEDRALWPIFVSMTPILSLFVYASDAVSIKQDVLNAFIMVWHADLVSFRDVSSVVYLSINSNRPVFNFRIVHFDFLVIFVKT